MTAKIEANALPRILVVSDSAVSPAHGTGCLLLAHFTGYPEEKLQNAYLEPFGAPVWRNSMQFNARVGGSTALAKAVGVIPRAYNKTLRLAGLGSLQYQRAITLTPDPAVLAVAEAPPQAVYSTAFSGSSLALTDRLCRALPADVPLLQYFMDYHVGQDRFSRHSLQRVLMRANEVWVLTDSMAEQLEPIARECGKIVHVQSGFCLDIPQKWKQGPYRMPNASFRCIMTGNVWQLSMVEVVSRLWRRVRLDVPDLRPIEWFCHAHSLRRVEAAIGGLPPEIIPMGRFVNEAELNDADLAILPFNGADQPEDNYARYSLPSRLTQLLSAGLPVFCIAGSGTPLARYVARHGIGLSSDAEDEERLAERVLGLVRDVSARQALGRRARAFAEREFPIGRFQQLLYGRLGARALGASGTAASPPFITMGAERTS